jgi:hypothetical protein
VSCTICARRKDKRFCPAVHGRICPQCCGEQREVTLDCPSSCVYLQQARAHEKPRPLEALDSSALFPEVEVGQQFLHEHEHLVVGLSYALATRARADRSLSDADLLAALTAIARSYQVLVNSGLHYETPVPGLRVQDIVREIQTRVQQYRETERKHLGFVKLRDSEVMKAVVFVLRLALARTSGRPKSRAFMDFLFAEFPEKESAVVGAEAADSSIIVP